MSLPEKFSEWEHLQDQVLRIHNPRVKAFFKNQADNDISTPKSSLKHACVMKDEDTAIMTLIRYILFEFDAGHAQSLQAPVYGIPVADFQGETKFKPQVHLHFQERYPYIADRIRAVKGEISFRLMNEDAATYTRAKAEQLAKDIKREFGTPIFVWNKGKYVYYYEDIEHGYRLRLYVISKAEGERVTKNVLAIRGHAFNDDYSDYVENTRSYPNNPGNQTIYGQSVPKPVKRPTADVRFRYAQLHLHGRTKVINLVATPEVALRQVIEKLNSV
ncbi:hypothetical protein H6G54_12080 [Anabaena cylindrica FACHB-243]|uniref:Uncharacterized protein n=1 Tax=Anabaena cylindrica (strain ATCC 27899 / PCC 7122) TaxID=272123 RepID=K9ZCG4_ANACC|nr:MULTISPECIES: hypothetical protein [Anabaena]AFZ56913.1 hypothetical protein Anacy_1402 [Anabaena cylindrica PCC 7122]MBD2418421.1 hypothetical protein [Anabaena cylindrica FACHB-243]MBY5284369.1 hypothetical protein [Anabaena sp. CCAP 1446/1C]MBY5307644.1 hypothetical protein [Anabaena sp. CCAP 1446/1C]MCM2409396.1 hypothetical protein [Anabaena sp. CCAP 1446/1C]